MNYLKTAMLLAILTVLLLWVGLSLGDRDGLMLASLLAITINYGSYRWSDKIVLRMYYAREATTAQAPELYRMVDELARRAALPIPKIFIIPEESPNAFATGRNPQHATIVVTAGLLRLLNREEIEGVVAHELSHIKNRDTLLMTVAAALTGSLDNFAGMSKPRGLSSQRRWPGNLLFGLINILFAPVALFLIQLTVSPAREFLADESAARLTGDPEALAAGLRKISDWSQYLPLRSGLPATAPLFIFNPFSSNRMARLINTHPAIEARIERLEAMSSRHLVALV